MAGPVGWQSGAHTGPWASRWQSDIPEAPGSPFCGGRVAWIGTGSPLGLPRRPCAGTAPRGEAPPPSRLLSSGSGAQPPHPENPGGSTQAGGMDRLSLTCF